MKRKLLRKATKLTSAHVYPTPGQKMRVFSRRTSTAMDSLKHVLTPSTDNTASLLLFFNVCNFCNSRNLGNCGSKNLSSGNCGMSPATMGEQNKLSYFRKTQLKQKALPFKYGWLVTLKSLECLINELLKLKKFLLCLRVESIRMASR